MNGESRRWARAGALLGGGVLSVVLAVVTVSAISGPEMGSTAPGTHNFRDLAAEGDASCEGCHFPPHYQHADLNTCSDCHVPEPEGHAARLVTCTTCHDMFGDSAGITTSPLPDTTTSTTASATTTTMVLPPNTTTPPATSTTTAAP